MNIKALLLENDQQYHAYQAAIEADLREWVKAIPPDELTIVQGRLPEWVNPLREYTLMSEAVVLQRSWLCFRKDLESVPRETL